MTEGTTRILETPAAHKGFGQEFYEQHGSLAQPTTRIPPQTNPTARSLSTEPKRQNWLLISTLLFAGLALIAAALVFTLRGRPTSAATAPVVTRPQIPPIPPPHPPSLPQGTGRGSNTINSEFIYPGAVTTMEVKDANKGNVIQLQTSDPFDKVVNWYTEKLKSAKTVRQNDGNESNAILDGEQMKAIISDDGSGKISILLHQGGD